MQRLKQADGTGEQTSTPKPENPLWKNHGQADRTAHKAWGYFAYGKSVFSCYQLLCFLPDYFIKAKSAWDPMQMSE